MNEYGKKGIPFLFIIDFEATTAEIFTDSEAGLQGILFQTLHHHNTETLPLPKKTVQFTKKPVAYRTYQSAFEKVKREILFGNSYLVNLTFPTPVKINLCLEEIFHRSHAKFKLYYPDRFVVFSPEIFVLIKDGKISSFPMKGTLDASVENAVQRLTDDPKEKAEHYTIVDLIRNDLSRVSTKVNVEKYRYIEQINTNQKSLLQASSHIVGILPSDYQHHIGSIITQILPAGSISGAPKLKTLEIIKSAETDERGYYTGVFGYFDGTDLESGVMIRYIEQTAAGYLYRSGGGITSMSDCKSEYKELTDKVYVPFI